MADERDRKLVQETIDAYSSDLKDDPWLAQRIKYGQNVKAAHGNGFRSNNQGVVLDIRSAAHNHTQPHVPDGHVTLHHDDTEPENDKDK